MGLEFEDKCLHLLLYIVSLKHKEAPKITSG